MLSRSELMARLAGTDGYEEVAREVGIPPGLAFMIATGLPADGSDSHLPPGQARSGSTQALVNPPTDNPKSKPAVEGWMKRRVGTDQAMHEAAEERTPEPPPIASWDDTDDIVSVIGWQHNQVNFLSQELQAIPSDDAHRPQKVQVIDMIRTRLVLHEAAEQKHFWPVVRQRLAGGDASADKAAEQERQGAELLGQLQEAPADGEGFEDLAGQLVDALRKHVALEDGVLLRFAEAVPEEERAAIGGNFRQTITGQNGGHR